VHTHTHARTHTHTHTHTCTRTRTRTRTHAQGAEGADEAEGDGEEEEDGEITSAPEAILAHDYRGKVRGGAVSCTLSLPRSRARLPRQGAWGRRVLHAVPAQKAGGDDDCTAAPASKAGAAHAHTHGCGRGMERGGGGRRGQCSCACGGMRSGRCCTLTQCSGAQIMWLILPRAPPALQAAAHLNGRHLTAPPPTVLCEAEERGEFLQLCVHQRGQGQAAGGCAFFGAANNRMGGRVVLYVWYAHRLPALGSEH